MQNFFFVFCVVIPVVGLLVLTPFLPPLKCWWGHKWSEWMLVGSTYEDCEVERRVCYRCDQVDYNVR